MQSEGDISVLARTIYGEARGEYHKVGLAGLIAVGNVVMNRLKQQVWFGRTIEEICLKHKQFSCWLENDPNYPLISDRIWPRDELGKVCQMVAVGIVKENWPDLTRGSDHYHHFTINPVWVDVKKLRCQIGVHKFYKL